MRLSMKVAELRRLRVTNQGIAAPRAQTPAEAVRTLCAMQAQDYAGGLWAIGLRLPGSTVDDVQRAVAEHAVVRTWPLRGTLHFVAAADVRWMMSLLAPRVISSSSARQAARGLDAATFRKVEKLLVRALEGGKQLTRDAARVLLERAKIRTDNNRLYHCLWRLAMEQVLCCGAPEGKQQTFALLDECVPEAKPLQPEEALVKLALRYFDGHGPATQQDLMRWAGLSGAEAVRGIAGAGKQLVAAKLAGEIYYVSASSPQPLAARAVSLLPAFDEFILGYKDRSAMVNDQHAKQITPGGGVFRATILHDGQIIGTWKAIATKRQVRITPQVFAPLSAAARRALEQAAQRYGEFLDTSATVL
jgi:hypothetical protein